MTPRDSHHRSIAKAVSWRATGTLDTFILSYLITGNLVFAGSIAGVETMTKIGLYYAHERVWAGIGWGRQQSDAKAPVLAPSAMRPIRVGATALDGHLSAVRSVRERGRATALTTLQLWTRRRNELAGAAAILAILLVLIGSPLSPSQPPSKAAVALTLDLPSSVMVALVEQPGPSIAPAGHAKYEPSEALPLSDRALPLQNAKLAEPDPVAAEQGPATALDPPKLADDAGSALERPNQLPRQSAPTRNLSDVDQARAVQQRLAELGFFHASATGVWGLNSRQALAAFKAQARLSGNDVWDEVTERSLFSAEIQGASFVGQWAPNAQACTPQLKQSGLLPATINEQGAWAGETTCRFQRKKQIGTAWTMVAACSDQRSQWTANVRLEIRGDRLTWTSERGSQTYVRCRQSQLYAQMAH